jgi:hypothetical protein
MRAILSRLVSLFSRSAAVPEENKTRRSLRTSQPESVQACVTLITGDLSLQMEAAKRTKKVTLLLRTENEPSLGFQPPKDEKLKKPKKVNLIE